MKGVKMIRGKMKWASIMAIAVSVSASPAWAQASAAAAKDSGVLYFSKQQTDAGFEKGVLVLYDSADQGGHYMVETPRRDTDGGGEVHVKDTELVYVVKGSAAVVTGGTLADINPHPATRPGNPHPEYEIRGARIVGGEEYHLGVGDMMIIPAGMPHQYKVLEAPFWYLVVKSRQP